MTAKEIKDFRSRVEGFIDKRRLRDAIYELRDTSRRRMAWEVTSRIDTAEENYRLMLSYLAKGIDDPDRVNVYNNIISDLYGILDSLVNFMERAENPSLYYSTLRYNLSNTRARSIADLTAEYRSLTADSIFRMVENGRGTDRRKIEDVQDALFMRVWTTPTLSADDHGALSEVIAGDYPANLKIHILSALMLGLMQQFDARRFDLLMQGYSDQTDIDVASAALTGLLIGLWTYRSRPLPRRMAARLAAVKELPTWRSDLSAAFIEMIRARDTERINRKMRDEVIPRMQSIRPDLMNKINDGSMDTGDMAGMAENPEWQEFLDKSGITDQLKELTEIQMEGGDVMMSTFAHLKGFPFFSRISNWFLPFDPEHSAVSLTNDELGIVGDVIENAVFLCDSDKYSFMMAINQVPQAQRDMMINQLKAQRDNIYEMMGSSKQRSADADGRRRSLNNYMQNIYRFFKLFSRRSEFKDPFDAEVNLIAVPVLADDFDDVETLEVVAEFYFKLKYMKEAMEVFAKMEELSPGNVQRYQKMGYASERLQRHADAIDYYQRAELLDSRSQWTLRRLAASYRASGDHKHALEYYRRLSDMNPDDMGIALQLGYTLLEYGDYREAIKQLYKVEYLDDKSSKAWRPLAWTLFLTGDFDGADRYYQKILLDHPSANDYLNMGHVALGRHDMHDAINYYRLAIASADEDKEWFMQALADDLGAMREAGIDPALIPLVADATLEK